MSEWLWKYTGRMGQLLTVILTIELIVWIRPYAYPLEFIVCGLIGMIAIFPFCFFSILHDVLNDKVDPIMRM